MPESVNEPSIGLAFKRWISEWSGEIEQAQEFTKTELPAMAAEIQADLSRTIREYPRMAELLAEVEGFIVKCRAQETLDVKSDPKFADLTGPERKTIVDSRMVPIVRTRDILKATCRALEERSYALLNQRNYERESLRMAGHGE